MVIHVTDSTGRIRTRHAKPVLETFELCDLLGMPRLPKSAESFKHKADRKSEFPTKFS